MNDEDIRERSSLGGGGNLTAARNSGPTAATTTTALLHPTVHHTASRRFADSTLVWLMSLIQRLLWPLRLVTNLFFPVSDTDGLAPAVTAKAAALTVAYLQSRLSPPAAALWATSAWARTEAMGFAAVQQQAIATQSLILVYLHAPLHAQTPSFCTHTLNHVSLLQWLQGDRILATAYSIHSAQGAQLQSLLQITSFPALAVLQPNPTTTIATVSTTSNILHLVLLVQGARNCRLDTLVPLLHGARQRHESVLAEAEVRRWQRLQETELRRQQDDEYQATLWADQERERLVAEERQSHEAAAAAEQQACLDRTQQAQTILQAAKDLVTAEPPAGGGTGSSSSGGGATTVLRLVLPSGAKLNRRFYSHETIASVKAFLTVHFAESSNASTTAIANIGLSTNFPRRTFESADEALTLEAAGLAPQAVLMVQDLDA